MNSRILKRLSSSCQTCSTLTFGEGQKVLLLRKPQIRGRCILLDDVVRGASCNCLLIFKCSFWIWAYLLVILPKWRYLASFFIPFTVEPHPHRSIYQKWGALHSDLQIFWYCLVNLSLLLTQSMCCFDIILTRAELSSLRSLGAILRK